MRQVVMKRRQFLQLTTALAATPLLFKLTGCDDGGDGGGTTSSGTGTTTTGGPGGGSAFRVTNSEPGGHPHSFVLVCGDMDKESVTYTAGGSNHTHQVSLTGDDLETIFNGGTVTIETADVHPHTWTITKPGNGCDGPAGPAPTSDSTAGGW